MNKEEYSAYIKQTKSLITETIQNWFYDLTNK